MWLLPYLLIGGCDVPPGASGEAVPVPSRFALRRMNRSEYDRTVRDLLGTAQSPAVDFPPDDAAGGFDNAADALATSPLLVEMVEDAAGRLVNEILREPLEAPIDLRLQPEEGAFTGHGPEWNHAIEIGWIFGSAGSVETTFAVPQSGRYRFTARVHADHAGLDGALFTLAADEVEIGLGEVPLLETGWIEVAFEATLEQRPVLLQLAYVNDLYDPILALDRNLYLDELRIEGPLDFVPIPNPAWDRVMICRLDGDDPRACTRRILEAFAPRAWRRPVDDAAIDGLMGVYDVVVDAGDTPAWGLEWALRAVLTSPSFVFLEERTLPDGTIDPWTLASRLSYFLWSSMPDDALVEKAADGTILDPAVLRAEALRMLRDPRAGALVDDLGGQWLAIRMLDAANPDPVAFPAWNELLRASMRGEMVENVRSFVGTDRSFRRLLDTERGYVDHTLAAFYGVETFFSFSYQPIDVAPVGRGGLLGQGGLLTALAYPTRTSPVRRGVWVLTNLLCDEPPPPPANVPGFPDPSAEAATIRERLEQHRKNPACAACHDRIDPVGLAFEHFDGIGAWRDADAGEPIDATGTLPDGTAVDGVQSLGRALADDERFGRCVVEKVWTYAHHRLPVYADEAAMDAIHEEFVAGDMTLDALVTALVTSETFQAPSPGDAP